MFGLFVYVVFYFHTFLDNVTIQGNKEDLLIHDRNQKTTHPSLSTHNLIFKIKYLLYYGFFLQRCPLPLIFVKPEGFFFAIVVGFFFVSCRLLVLRILYFFHLSNVWWFCRPFHHLAVVKRLLPGYKPFTVVLSFDQFPSSWVAFGETEKTNSQIKTFGFQKSQSFFSWVKINVFKRESQNPFFLKNINKTNTYLCSRFIRCYSTIDTHG